MSKRIIAAILTLVMLLGMLPMSVFATESSAEMGQLTQSPVTAQTQDAESSEQTENTTLSDTIAVTRAQWVQALVETFSMTVEEDNYPDNYFSDLTGEEDYYRDILVAVEFGVIDIEAGLPFAPDAAATREFAAQTLNACLGFQLEEAVYSFSEAETVTYPADIQVAVNRGWFALVNGAFLPEQAITTAEKDAMLADAAEILASDVIDESYENSYEFTEEVIELPENTAAQLNSDTELLLANPATPIAQGDIFAVYLDGYPLIYQANAVSVSGTLYTVTVTRLAINDYLVSVDAQGSTSVDLADFIPEDDVEPIYVLEDGSEVNSVQAAGTKKIKSIYFIEDIEGYKVDIQIYDMKLNWRSTGYSLKTAEVSAVVTGQMDVTVSLPFSADASDLDVDLTLGKFPIGYVGDITVKAELSIDGSVTVDYGTYFKFGVSYGVRDGFRIPRDFQKKCFSVTVEATLKIGLKATAALYDIPLLSATCSASAGVKCNCTVRYRGNDADPQTCIHTDSWLYAQVNTYAMVGIPELGEEYYKSWSGEHIIWSRSNSPVRSVSHFEDGEYVTSCSYGDTNWGGYGSNYFSPFGSRYANGGVSGVANVPTYSYELNDYNDAIITGYSGSTASLSIPATIDGYKVVEIGDGAFCNNSSLSSVTVPSGVTRIGDSAFSGCSNLRYVNLPDTLTEIGAYTFAGCTSLMSIDIPDSVTVIYGQAFRGCSSLSKVELSANLKELADWFIFGDCVSLRSIFIPKSLESASSNTFSGCTNLKEVTFEEGMTRIPDYILHDCPGIEQIVIPDSVTAIGNNAFESAINLTDVTMPDSVTLIEEGAFSGCTSLEEIALSESLVTIDSYAFYNCTALKSIDIPDTVTTIGGQAFRNCTSLADVKLSNNLVELPDWFTFGYCTALESIFIPKSLESASSNTFSGCTNLKEVTFEDGMTRIPDYILHDCPGIEQIVIPDSVTAIGNNAFESAINLTDVTMPDSVTLIEEGAFSGCASLEEIELSENLVTIGSYAFYKCTALKAIDIPDTVTVIKGQAFRYCSSLADVKLSANLVKLADWFIFGNCTALESIVIPKSLESASSNTFTGCTALKEVTFEDGMTRIPEYILHDCPGIEQIVIPDSVTAIGNNAFESAINLSDVTMSNSVTLIEEGAFSGCTSLEEIALSESLVTIADYAFYKCSGLKSIDIPDSVTYIGGQAFRYCTALEAVELSENLTDMDDWFVFAGCTALKSITIPESLKVCGTNAFSDCTSLESVTLHGGMTELADNMFSNCDSLTAVTIPDGVTHVSSSCFYDCDALETVEMANSVTGMGTSVFRHCDSLQNVTLSQNLASIPSDTFRECAKLAEIVIPYYCTSIGSNAFNASSKLAKVVTREALASIGSGAFSYPNTTVFYGVPGSYTETWCADNGYKFNENTTAATSVTLSHKTVSIPKGTTYTLGMTIAPIDFADTIIFKSGNTAVATVDETGKITAVSTGTATIKVIVGSASASCKVTVTQGVTKITLDKTTLALDVPDTYQLTATIAPTDASNQVLAWTSSNEAAATVDANGLVTAVGNGTAVITATATDGTGISASCTVTVTDPNNIPVTGITLDKTTLSMEALETWQLTATITPDNAANKTLAWTSSDASVATVDANGIVTAISKGTAVITAAATDDSGITASCTVTVTNNGYVVNDVSGLESSHNYSNSCNDFWLYTVAGAESLQVTFDERTEMEDGFDYLHIYGANDTLIGTYTGTELAGQTVVIPGDTVKIKIDSDDSGSEWGFKVTEVTAKVHEHTYETAVTDPTCTEDGCTTRTCTVCGESSTEVIPALGHDFADGVCTRCGAEDPDYVPETEVASGWSGSLTWTLYDSGRLVFAGSGAMKNYGYNGGQPWLNKGVDVTSVVFPEGVTSIGSGAFRNLTTLKSVTFPATTLTKMGEAAFYGSGLESVEIPASLWTIQPYTFKNCANLKSIKFNEGNLQKISDGSFYGCTSLTELVLPDCLGILDIYAFKGCSKLADITIGAGLTELREAVFYGTAIPTIDIPEGITKIGPYAFKNCVKLVSVDFPSTLTSVGEASFYACTALKTVELPDKVTTIGNYAFRKCAAIETLTFGSELTTIGECGFYGCTSLTELVIPDKVTTIKPYAFKTCTGLTSVTLGSSVKTIGEGAFNTCTGLTSIVFPASLTAIGDYCFSGSTGIWKMTFQGDAPSIGTGAFKSISATAYYPSGNSTWTASVRQNYGGSITWKAQ